MRSRFLITAALFLLAGAGAHTSAVPAPRDRVQAPSIVGAWDLTWGSGLQQSTFLADGSCNSPQFGAGSWSLGADGSIWFGEGDDRCRYVMGIDWGTFTGRGAWIDSEGSQGGWVDVSLKRRVK